MVENSARINFFAHRENIYFARINFRARGYFRYFSCTKFAQEPVFMSIFMSILKQKFFTFIWATDVNIKPHYRTIFEEISNHLRAVPIWANFWYLFSHI